jgi:hypothetical protein
MKIGSRYSTDIIAILSKPNKREYKINQQEEPNGTSGPMWTIKLMSSIPDPPYLIILGPTHPTPFLPTSGRTRRALDMITPIHLLNPPATVARLGVRFKPYAGWFIGGKVFVAEGGPVLRAGQFGMSRGTALEA